jgi:hypothetical protein
VFNKTRWGDIPKLNHTNYDEWKDDIILILSAMRGYAIVTGEDPVPQPLDLDHDDNNDDWKANKSEAASMIKHSCAPKVRRIIKGIRNPHKVLNALETRLDAAGSYFSAQDNLRQFRACRPEEDEPLKVYFSKLSNYRIELDHTDDAITDRDFSTQIFTSLPTQYVMILMVLEDRRPFPTPKEAMHDLVEEETTASLMKELGDISTRATIFAQLGGYDGRCHGRIGSRGHGGCCAHGGNIGSGDSHKSNCT